MLNKHQIQSAAGLLQALLVRFNYNDDAVQSQSVGKGGSMTLIDDGEFSTLSVVQVGKCQIVQYNSNNNNNKYGT